MTRQELMDRGVCIQCLENDARILEAENARPKALTEWRPIETAPKGDPDNVFDHPTIDLFAGTNRYENCFFDRTTGYWTMRVRYRTKSGNQKTVFMKIKNPTHWMPLPEPPEVTP